MVAYLCSPVDHFREFPSAAFELHWLHQERPVLVWSGCHASAVQPPFHAVWAAADCGACRCCIIAPKWKKSKKLPNYRILHNSVGSSAHDQITAWLHDSVMWFFFTNNCCFSLLFLILIILIFILVLYYYCTTIILWKFKYSTHYKLVSHNPCTYSETLNSAYYIQ